MRSLDLKSSWIELPNLEIDSAWSYDSIIGDGETEAGKVIVSNENCRCLRAGIGATIESNNINQQSQKG